MTQQYLVGQFSVLLGDLEQDAADWQAAVHRLRRHVEASPPATLTDLAAQVTALSDDVCWGLLERGDFGRFRACAKTAAALAEFIECAGFGPSGR